MNDGSVPMKIRGTETMPPPQNTSLLVDKDALYDYVHESRISQMLTADTSSTANRERSPPSIENQRKRLENELRYFFGQLLSKWYIEIGLVEKQTQAVAYFGVSEAQYVEVAVWSKALASYILRWEKEVT
ncbi:hypothetical protein MMC13_005413 [Lambiella insularis]|nr:hypothetical protein [Lambiella insularis]